MHSLSHTQSRRIHLIHIASLCLEWMCVEWMNVSRMNRDNDSLLNTHSFIRDTFIHSTHIHSRHREAMCIKWMRVRTHAFSIHIVYACVSSQSRQWLVARYTFIHSWHMHSRHREATCNKWMRLDRMCESECVRVNAYQVNVWGSMCI